MIDGIDLTVVVVNVCVCGVCVLLEAAICDHKVCCYQGPQQCSGGSVWFINISSCRDVDTFIENGHQQCIAPPTETSVMLMNISLYSLFTFNCCSIKFKKNLWFSSCGTQWFDLKNVVKVAEFKQILSVSHR